MTEIRFVDTTIRDGPQSLWANNIRTGAILSVAPLLDRAGFEAIETIYVDPKKIVRELKEDPWERLRLLRERVTETPLRLITGRFNPFWISPPVIWELWMACMARVGCRQARITDEWNQADLWAWKVKVAREVGIDPVINLIFSESPRHTDAYYAERARQASSLDIYRLCLKDPGGLLTPERMRTLVPAILANANGKYVELHSHCTTGLGPLNALEAVQLGIKTVNVGVPPLANGSALPNIFNITGNLRVMGHEPVIEEATLQPVMEQLTSLARRERFPIGTPVEYDASQYAHQVPGGMITNLRHQLGLVGLAHKMDETLEECIRVRTEWGWPIMVTPLSQFVGTQAAINVIVGERYKEVTDQTIYYALGYWGGEEAIHAMAPDVRDKILNRPRARELAAWEPPQPTVKELRERYGGPGVSDEEMLLRLEVSPDEIAAMRAAAPSTEGLSVTQPLVTLIQELTRRADRSYIHLQKGDLSLTLRKREPS
jgi:oxaloacetate decarboxylase alpha subunit